MYLIINTLANMLYNIFVVFFVLFTNVKQCGIGWVLLFMGMYVHAIGWSLHAIDFVTLFIPNRANAPEKRALHKGFGGLQTEKNKLFIPFVHDALRCKVKIRDK